MATLGHAPRLKRASMRSSDEFVRRKTDHGPDVLSMAWSCLGGGPGALAGPSGAPEKQEPASIPHALASKRECARPGRSAQDREGVTVSRDLAKLARAYARVCLWSGMYH